MPELVNNEHPGSSDSVSPPDWEPTEPAVDVAGLSAEQSPRPPAVEDAAPPKRMPVAAATPAPEPLGFDPGQAGASARREHQRRKRNREERVRAKHKVLGGLILALQEAPQSETAWARGAGGEEHVQAVLAQRCPAIPILHDRRIPGTKANIDHIAVTPTGVWVIDAKRYAGRLEVRRWGGRSHLTIRGRDKTALATGVKRQAEKVNNVVKQIQADVPVHPSLCFIDTEWGLFGRPFKFQDCYVTWVKKLAKELNKPGPLEPEQIVRIAQRLDEHFPRA